jgi:Flp pilus assembly protein TadG
VRRRAESGAVALEFALVLPILLVLLFYVVNFGVVFAQQIALNSAVREGARQGVVAGSSARQCGQVVDAVRSATSAPDLASAGIDVSVQLDRGGTLSFPCDADPATEPCAGSFDATTGIAGSLTVQADYSTTFLIPFPVPGLGTGLDLSARAVYRCEFS